MRATSNFPWLQRAEALQLWQAARLDDEPRRAAGSNAPQYAREACPAERHRIAFGARRALPQDDRMRDSTESKIATKKRGFGIYGTGRSRAPRVTRDGIGEL